MATDYPACYRQARTAVTDFTRSARSGLHLGLVSNLAVMWELAEFASKGVPDEWALLAVQ